MAMLSMTDVAARILALPANLQAQAIDHMQRAYGKQPTVTSKRTQTSLLVPETTLTDFVTNRHFQIDRMPFDWPNHQYLIPLYNDFLLDPEHTEGLELVVMKGAQVGMSVWGMTGMLFTALKFPGAWTGYFLPDQGMTDIFSANRFKPLVDSNPPIARLLGNEREGINRTRLRNLGPSTILFSYMGGKTSTESAPLLGIFLDEVRRMNPLQINLTHERISHSPYPINIKLSTAGYPQNDIHHYFLRTDQRYFHSDCNCSDGIALAEEWPACIGQRAGDVFYRCPRCDTTITDPQRGRYIAHAPSKTVRGYHVPQTLSRSPLHTATALWEKYTDARGDRGEFVRSSLGRPFVDPEAQLVTEDHLQGCVTPDTRWQTEGTNCAMGIDQMGGWNDVVLFEPSARGKHRLVHLERISGDDPFGNDAAAQGNRGRLDQLMHDFDVSCCVCDMNPNYNDAMRFAKRWSPRAFLVTYAGTDRAPMIAWRDRVRRQRDQQPNEDDVKFKYVVTIQRYKALDWALGLFAKRELELPHPDALVQTTFDDQGVVRPMRLARELYWPHVQRIVRQKHPLDDDQGTFKMEMVKIGADPHFAFAHLYGAVALSRLPGGRVAIL
jgi:hypothetical protein